MKTIIKNRYAEKITAIILFVGIFAANAQEQDKGYSDDFFGLSTELSVISTGDTLAFDSLATESICLTASFGKRGVFAWPPVRVRGGLGFWPGRYFIAKLGAEIAAFEILSPMRGRMFGVYAYADGIARIGGDGIGFSFEPSVRVLIPLSPIGGLAIGAGYDTALGLVFHADYLAGFYAITK